MCHGNKRNPETVRIAFCWETPIVCSHLPLSAGGSIERNTSFTGHGKNAVTSYVGSMSGDVTVSMYQRLRASCELQLAQLRIRLDIVVGTALAPSPLRSPRHGSSRRRSHDSMRR